MGLSLALVAGLFAFLTRGQPTRPRLTTIVHGGDGPPTLILLHGYGSSADKWRQFTSTILLPPKGRFLFPQAPFTTVPPDGPVDGRAWWRLDLASYIRPGTSVPDLSVARPQGLAPAAELVRELVTFTRNSHRGTIVLGGFSQGAMVATEIACSTDGPLDALVLLSGTLVDEAVWERGCRRRRGLPVFIAHGRHDRVLSFDIAERLRAKLHAAGLAVTWSPFEGGHEIPAEVVTGLNAFLRSVGVRP